MTFNEPVTEFTAADISLSTSTANVSAAAVVITGSGTTYNVAVTNFSSNGQTVRASVTASAVSDSFGNPSTASTVANIVADNTAPTVTVNQAPAQPDPAAAQPINFSVVFSESVAGFTTGDLSFSGSTANLSIANVTIAGTGTTYNVSVSNIISSGVLQVSLAAGAANDPLGNSSIASQSIDNTVVFELPPFAGINGRVSDLTGRGLSRARIEVVLANGDKMYTHSNPFGFYRLVDVPTGLITINATRKNGAPASVSFYLLSNSSGNNFSFL